MKIKNWFKKRNKTAFNIYHPDNSEKVEVAFEAGGKKYYRFTQDLQMPAGRYKYIYAALREVDLRMDADTMRKYLQEMKKCISGKKQEIDLEGLWKLIFNMETRANLGFEPFGVKKLAAVTFFDETEDLGTYDTKHGEQKIAFWDKNNVLDFFLTMPISGLLGLSNSSPTFLEDLKEYIQTSEMIIQDLNQELPNPSQENTSENGKKTL